MIDILVIDDEELLRDLLMRILRREGYKAESAGNGKEGLQIFSATPARLVVIDMNMPEMDGATTIEALRQHYRDFSVLAMSGNARMSKAADADATITKPFLPAAFIGLVKDLLPHGSGRT